MVAGAPPAATATGRSGASRAAKSAAGSPASGRVAEVQQRAELAVELGGGVEVHGGSLRRRRDSYNVHRTELVPRQPALASVRHARVCSEPLLGPLPRHAQSGQDSGHPSARRGAGPAGCARCRRSCGRAGAPPAPSARAACGLAPRTGCARRRRPAPRPRLRRPPRRGHRSSGGALGRDRPAGEAVGSASRPSSRCSGADLRVAGEPGPAPAAGATACRARSVKRDQLPGSGSVGGGARHEALLRRLLGHPHAAADVGPRRAGPAGLVHEVADEVVGHLAEVLGDEHGVGQVREGVAVGVLGPDAASMRSSSRTDGFGHASTLS